MPSILRLDQLQTLTGTNVMTFDTSGNVSIANQISNLKLPVWNDTTRPTTSLSIGLIGWNTESKSIEIYNGVDPSSGNPVWMSVAAVGGGGQFPPAYQQIIDAFTGTKYYVDPAGSNSGAGTEAAPWQTINYAITTAVTGSMIIVKPGTYQQSAVMFEDNSFTSKIYWDNGKNLRVVCAPGQVKIIGPATDPGERDFHHIIQTNSSSKLYGCIIYRNNNGRTENYSNAIFGYPTPAANTGEVYNTFFRETGSNGRWSLHYDNPNDHSWKAFNSSFMGSTWLGNYTGGSSTQCVNCAGSVAWVSSGTNTSPLQNATFNNNFSCQSSTQGVYSGTYAWDLAKVTQTL